MEGRTSRKRLLRSSGDDDRNKPPLQKNVRFQMLKKAKLAPLLTGIQLAAKQHQGSQKFEYVSSAMVEESGMSAVNQTVGNVLCCNCGIVMTPNAANKCARCLQAEFDITEGLQKRVVIMWCPGCQSYLQPPRTWIKAQLESKELLTFCLGRLENVNRIVSAEFVWTEPHSKRIKVKLKVNKKVHDGVVLEQAYVVEYVQKDHKCEACSRVKANPDDWVASVQLRQHVSHRRTFFYLEQLVLKHNAAVRAINVSLMDKGIDIFFAKQSHALKFMEFVGKFAPTNSCRDKRLMSTDTKGSKYNHRYTFSVEICPICRQDLIFLPPNVAAGLGNLGPLVLCAKVSNSLLLLDPLTLRHAFIEADQYWRTPFKPLLSYKQLVEYVVLDVEPVGFEVHVSGSKYSLADVQVARVSDYRKNDKLFTIRTHLGHLLNPGDYAHGYDLRGASSDGIEPDEYKRLVIPDAILIKKSYKQKQPKKCGKLHNTEVDTSSKKHDENKMNAEYEEFLKNLEKDPELTFNISLASVADGDDVPSVELDELLANLDLSDEEDEKMVL